MVFAIGLPVIGIAFQQNTLTWPILLNAKRSQPDQLGGRRIQRPRLLELAFTIRLFQDVTRQNRKTVKQPLGRGVRAGKREAHRILIQLGDRQRLAIDQQQIALRSADGFVQINGERKDHVVRVERVPSEKRIPLRNLSRKGAAVRRHFPGLRQRRFGLLRRAVDRDQVSVQAFKYFARQLRR